MPIDTPLVSIDDNGTPTAEKTRETPLPKGNARPRMKIASRVMAGNQRAVAALSDDNGKRFPEAIRCLQEGRKDKRGYFSQAEIKRLKSGTGK